MNTSLGYYSFDDPAKNYRYRDLNGPYALMSREALKAADKEWSLFVALEIRVQVRGRRLLLRETQRI